jgi:KaiC/GvpD/RAD55 family RecA-like ATPase
METIAIEKIPSQLSGLDQWVVWKTVVRDGKPTKIPFQPNGSAASSTDEKTWSTIYDCMEVVANYDGLGFVFSKDDPFIGVDLDGCISDSDGEIQDWAKDVIKTLGSYTEISPSGTGVKIFGMCNAPWTHRKKVELDEPVVSEKKRPGVEVYDSGRYFAVTSKRLKGMSVIQNIDNHTGWLADKFGMRQQEYIQAPAGVTLETPVSERAIKYLAKMEPSISGQDGHKKCFAAACVLIKGFELTESEALRILQMEFNPRCQPPWSDRELQHKVSQAKKQPGATGYLRDALPEQWSKIRLPSNYKEKPQEPEPEKHEIRVSKVHDAARSYIEQLKDGSNNLVCSGIPKLDYAIGGGFALGEMVVVAARPSHGKSMIALQMAHAMTQAAYPVALVSEEMSALALGKRAVQFVTNVPEQHWAYRSEDVLSEIDQHFSKRVESFIIESCGTVERACSEIEKLIDSQGVKVAMIDYAQLLRTKGGSRYEQISDVSSTLRMFASRTGVLLIVLAQLNRSIESRPKFEPKMSDIKETGQLEQDADVILFGVWPYRVDQSNDPKTYSIYVAKNRNREIRDYSFDCEFNPTRQMLTEKDSDIVEHENYDHSFSAWSS